MEISKLSVEEATPTLRLRKCIQVANLSCELWSRRYIYCFFSSLMQKLKKQYKLVGVERENNEEVVRGQACLLLFFIKK